MNFHGRSGLQALLPVHDRMAERIGPDLLAAIYRATGFRRDGL